MFLLKLDIIWMDEIIAFGTMKSIIQIEPTEVWNGTAS